MKNLLMLLVFFMGYNTLAAQNCPRTPCDEHVAYVNIDTVPNCAIGSWAFKGDIDNNSDCENEDGLNCFKWVISRNHGSQIGGFTVKLGQGDGCNGEVDVIYSQQGGICENHGSTGSQNELDFYFLNDDEISIWMCDISSGEVGLCDLCSNLPLPIEFSSFVVRPSGSSNELFWETESEYNNLGFEIQRGESDIRWTTIAFVESYGDSDTKTQYTFIDEDVPCHNVYYRLKQINLDGDYTFSQTVLVYNKDVDLLSDAIENGTLFNQYGQRVTDKKGLRFIYYKGETFKVYFVQ